MRSADGRPSLTPAAAAVLAVASVQALLNIPLGLLVWALGAGVDVLSYNLHYVASVVGGVSMVVSAPVIVAGSIAARRGRGWGKSMLLGSSLTLAIGLVAATAVEGYNAGPEAAAIPLVWSAVPWLVVVTLTVWVRPRAEAIPGFWAFLATIGLAGVIVYGALQHGFTTSPAAPPVGAQPQGSGSVRVAGAVALPLATSSGPEVALDCSGGGSAVMSAALVGDTKVTPFTAYELQWTFNQDGAPGAFTGSGPHTAVTSPIYVEFYEAATEYGAPATDEWWVGASGTVSYDPHSRSGTLSAVLVPEQGSDFDGTNAASGTATVSATWKCPPS